jgi:uncharacterized SAM-binding protein YcdF (DUF218 family)
MVARWRRRRRDAAQSRRFNHDATANEPGGREPNATLIVVPSMPCWGLRAFMVGEVHQSEALPTAAGTGAPAAAPSVGLDQRSDRRHRPRTRRRAQGPVRPAHPWAAAVASTVKGPRARSRGCLRHAALTLPALVAAAGLWLVPAPLIRAAAAWWVVSDPLTPADAVLVLGGGFDRRPLAAAALYRRGLVRQVLIAQVARPLGPLGLNASSESARSRAALVAAGVPAAAIAPFGNDVASTYDEAHAAAGWAATHGARRLIVPTDWYHARRVSWVFRALAPPGVVVSVLALPPPGAAAVSGDWPNLTMLAREALKYCYYRIRYHRAVREATSIGLSPAPSTPT